MDRVIPHRGDSADRPAGRPRNAAPVPAEPTPDSIYLAAKLIRRRIRLALLASRLEATLTRS